MKAHKKDMIYQWAKENGIKGYENYDPKMIEKRRQEAVIRWNKENRPRFHSSAG